MSEIYFGWPEWIWVASWVLALFCTALMDGEPRLGRYSLASAMLMCVVSVLVMYFGGFFSGPNP